MAVFSMFAVGGVYVWAGVPLIGGALALAVLAPLRPCASRETRLLDTLLVITVLAAVFQLVPLPPSLGTALSPHARGLRAAYDLQSVDSPQWQPLSVSPAATAYAIGLVLTALIVFWTARWACARGMTHRIVRALAVAGLVAALVAIALQTAGERALIYGRWPALDAGARPFGPFVNRNHFATWVVMAGPLAAGYVAAALRLRPSSSGRAAIVAVFESLGTSAVWVGVAGIVMSLALAISTSRSGLVSFATSLVAGAWLARTRLTRQTALIALAGVVTIALAVAAYINVQPLLARVDETLAVGAGGRPGIWQETLRVIRDFPLTGTGLGGYQTAMLVYQQTDRAVFINQAHNQYLHLLAEGGLLVGIPSLLAAVAFVRLFRARLARDTSSSVWLRIGGAAALIAVAVQGVWETGLRIPANGLLFAIAAAVTVHRPPGGSRDERERTPPPL
jgi:O-antigen ligase